MNADEKPLVAIDLGGTKILVCLVSMNSRISILSRQKFSTPTSKSANDISDFIRIIVSELLAKRSLLPEQISHIGICSTGIVDTTNGLVVSSVNLPFNNFPLGSSIQNTLNIPVLVENDAKSAAIGEYYYGAGRNKCWDSMIHIVMGTGIGGAIILGGKLVRGLSNLAGEFGHMSIDPNGPVCRCGRSGCVDAFASAHAIQKYVDDKMKFRDSRIPFLKANSLKEILAAANQGDELAIEAFKRSGNALGILISNLCHAFNPDGIVLSGGVLSCKEFVLPQMLNTINERTFPLIIEKMNLELAVLGEDAGIFGICRLATRHPR